MKTEETEMARQSEEKNIEGGCIIFAVTAVTGVENVPGSVIYQRVDLLQDGAIFL